MIRDDEIQRLVNYIKGIGLKITFSSKKGDCSACWYLDNSGIVIYKSKNVTKIETVLSLIHELGHAMHSIHEKDREIDTKFEKALDSIDEAEELEIDTKKKQRKIVLDSEIAGTNYWHSVYKETNMKFPIWKLEAQMEYDMWQYEVFYETGSYPKAKDRKKKFKEISNRHRGKNG
jgi:hypothetical protein